MAFMGRAAKAAEGILLPVKLGAAPVRRLGDMARQAVSSQAIAKQRMAEDALTMRQRDMATTIALASFLRGHLHNRYVSLPEEQRAAIQAQLDANVQRIGHLVLDAHDANYANLFSMVDQRPDARPALDTEY